MENKKRKNLTIICLIVLILLLGTYFVYKISIINYYNIVFENTNVSFDIKEEKVIDKTNYEGDYIIHNDIKMPDFFDNFTISEENNDIIYTDKTNEDIKMVLPKSVILSPKKDFEKITLGHKAVGKKIIRENNLNNDIELLKYLENYKTSKRTVFSNVDRMLNDEVVYNFTSFYYLENVTLFTGSVTAFMVENLDSDCKYVYIINDDVCVTIMLYGSSYFTSDYVIDLLSKTEVN